MLYNTKLTQFIADRIAGTPTRSAWQRGVLEYAEELLQSLDENIKSGFDNENSMQSPFMLEDALLDGARNWFEYSCGGCSLIYDGDIAERVCTKSELKRKKNGKIQPNARETWLDVQGRALYQAAQVIKKHAKDYFKGDYHGN